MAIVSAAHIACPHNDRELRQELARESASSGLALAAASSWYITVFPFDSDERNFRTEQPRQLLAFGKAGRMLVWIDSPSFMEPSRFFVESTTGETVTQINRRAASRFSPLALSEAVGRVAFWGALQGAGAPQGLHWASADFSRSGFIGDGVNCDWSPEGASLVYEKQGKIYVFDTASGSSRLLVNGHDPSWRPDGECIAFRSPDGGASLVTTGGTPVNWPLSTVNRLGRFVGRRTDASSVFLNRG